MSPATGPRSEPPDGCGAAADLDPSRVETVLCDLDGVVWLAHEPLPGAVDAIAAIRSSGRRVVFVTNNSAARVADHEAALERIGVPAHGDVVSSSMAAATLVDPGERILVTGGPGVAEAVELAGAIVVSNTGDESVLAAGIDAVVVGLHRDFDYRRLAVASAALHGGARLIGTNDDATYPTPRGAEPGGGAILAAVAVAGERTPVIAGKPHPPMAAAIARTLVASGPAALVPATMLMVGDRPETDGLMASTLRCPFVLVRSGVTPPGSSIDEIRRRVPRTGDAEPLRVALDIATLAELATRLCRGDTGISG